MQRHDRKTIALLFTTLEAGGVKLPESFQSDTGWNLALELWSGAAGAEPFDYRWSVVKDIVGDILRGKRK